MVGAIRASFVNVCTDTVRLLVPDSIIAPESPQALLATHGAFMSEVINCDPDRGFVALPVALFDLDLTPGAFRTLAELCRMANAAGECWPSLGQLGRRLGRSRASVSAYIAELRAAQVITTQEQKMANGYNYRLRYTVSFWKKWRAGLGQKPKTAAPIPLASKPERRVQQIERPLETKKHIHKNKQSLRKSPDLIAHWKRLTASAPYPSFDAVPPQALLVATKAALFDAPPDDQAKSADIAAAFTVFAQDNQLTGDAGALAEAMTKAIPTKAKLERVMTKLAETWQRHWRVLPNKYQIKRLLETLPPCSDAVAEHKLLKSYVRRWELHQQSLPSAGITPKVAA
jgi:DNA-binding MarR family transcriptional regulator